MSYTPPSSTAANFSWVGAHAYTPPASNAAHFSWVPPVDDVVGVGAGVVSVTGAGVGALVFSAVGVGVVPITGAGTGQYGEIISGDGVGVVQVVGGGVGLVGAAGVGAGVVPVVGGGAGDSGASGAGSAVVPIAGAAVAVHHRYELRGEVRLGGVLVNRRVHAYLRETGELLGSADTVAGRFRVHAGFAEVECYVTPIDMDPAAVDWLPPTANRILSVLADDTL